MWISPLIYLNLFLTSHIQAAEPVILLLSSYLSYMTSEMLRFSSIMAILTNAILVEQYAVCNIARNSKISLKLIAETLSTSSEGVKFYFLYVVLFVLCLESKPGRGVSF